MGPRFKDTDRHSLFLMPPSLDDWVAEDHLARFVVDIVSRLDLSPIRNSYAGRGSNAYPPSMMAALLFYAYATGVFSSRKIEQATYDSVNLVMVNHRSVLKDSVVWPGDRVAVFPKEYPIFADWADHRF